MSFEEAMDAEVSREEACREVQRHGHEPADFLREVGDQDTYNGSEVLIWLGY